jgi:hypothetical protein
MAQVEVRHEQKLYEVYSRVAAGGQDRESFESTIVPGRLEGGFDAKELLEANKSHLQIRDLRCWSWP